MTEEEDISREDFIRGCGLDPETIEGDYAEAYHWCQKRWNSVSIDRRFEGEYPIIREIKWITKEEALEFWPNTNSKGPLNDLKE